MFKIILLVTVVGAAMASGNNKCPWVMGKYPFDESKFAGKWHVVAYTASPDKRPHTCKWVDYQVTKDGHTSSYSAHDEDGKEVKFESLGAPLFGKAEKAANSLVVYKKKDGTYSGTYKQAIATTDYENYAVVIGCRQLFNETTKTFGRHVKAAIFARNVSLPTETVEILKNVISGYDIDMSTVKMMDNTKC